MGTFGLYSTFFLIAITVNTGGYELAVVTPTSDRVAAYVTVLGFLLALPLTAGGVVVLVVLRANAWLGYGSFPIEGVAILAVALLAGGYFSVARYWLLRQQRLALLSRAVPLQQGARAGSQIAFGFAGMGFAGLAAGDMLGRLAGAVVAVAASLRSVSACTRPFRRSELVQVAARYRKFPLLSAPSSLLDMVGGLLPLPLVAQHYGLVAAGYFTLVQGVLTVPAALIGASVADVFHIRIAKVRTAEPTAAGSLFFRTAGWLLAVGSVPALILLVAGPWLFGTIFGSDWVEAGRLAAAMSIWFLAGLAVGPVSRSVFVYEGQSNKLIYDLLSLASTLGVFVWASAAGATLVHMAWVLSVLQALAYVVYFMLLLRTLRKGLTE